MKNQTMLNRKKQTNIINFFNKEYYLLLTEENLETELYKYLSDIKDFELFISLCVELSKKEYFSKTSTMPSILIFNKINSMVLSDISNKNIYKSIKSIYYILELFENNISNKNYQSLIELISNKLIEFNLIEKTLTNIENLSKEEKYLLISKLLKNEPTIYDEYFSFDSSILDKQNNNLRELIDRLLEDDFSNKKIDELVIKLLKFFDIESKIEHKKSGIKTILYTYFSTDFKSDLNILQEDFNNIDTNSNKLYQLKLEKIIELINQRTLNFTISNGVEKKKIFDIFKDKNNNLSIKYNNDSENDFDMLYFSPYKKEFFSSSVTNDIEQLQHQDSYIKYKNRTMFLIKELGDDFFKKEFKVTSKSNDLSLQTPIDSMIEIIKDNDNLLHLKKHNNIIENKGNDFIKKEVNNYSETTQKSILKKFNVILAVGNNNKYTDLLYEFNPSLLYQLEIIMNEKYQTKRKRIDLKNRYNEDKYLIETILEEIKNNNISLLSIDKGLKLNKTQFNNTFNLLFDFEKLSINFKNNSLNFYELSSVLTNIIGMTLHYSNNSVKIESIDFDKVNNNISKYTNNKIFKLLNEVRLDDNKLLDFLELNIELIIESIKENINKYNDLSKKELTLIVNNYIKENLIKNTKKYLNLNYNLTNLKTKSIGFEISNFDYEEELDLYR